MTLNLRSEDLYEDAPSRLSLVSATFREFISSSAARIAKLPEQTVHAIYYVDADNLKKTNDTLGHAAGDELISAIQQKLTQLFPRDAVILRKGGDEFIVYRHFAPGSGREAQRTGKEVTAHLNMAWGNAPNRKQLSCSIGMATTTDATTPIVELVDCADVALLAAKRSGKGQLKLFGEQDCKNIQLERQIVRDFECALARDAIEAHFQPIFNIARRQICGAEALLRWDHQDHGAVPAGLIVQAATEVGRLFEVGQYILRRACLAALNWPEDIFVSVNFPASDFRRRGFASEALKTMRDIGISPDRFRFEITEIEYLEITPTVTANLVKLQVAGVKIGVDDFGTGHSSMGHIDQFPADFIKIDRSLIKNCNKRLSSHAFLRAIAYIAQHSHTSLVAEGVETVEELGVVRSTGISLAQGFYYSPAVSQSEFSLALKRNNIWR